MHVLYGIQVNMLDCFLPSALSLFIYVHRQRRLKKMEVNSEVAKVCIT